MSFTVLNKQIDSDFQEIIRRIRRLQSGGTIDSLREIGADTSKQIGASYLSLKQLASCYTPNEQLALLLWKQQKREEQIIACFLLPEGINKEKITQLFQDCLNFEIAGYLGSLYLYKDPDLAILAETWCTTGTPFQQLAILTAIAKHLILFKKDSKITKEYFTGILNQHFEDKYVQLAAERYRFNI